MGTALRGTFLVVVGVDFSNGSRAAIDEAVHLARLLPITDLHFVHVVETSPDLHDAQVIAELADNLGRVMARLEQHVRDILYTRADADNWGCEIAFHVRLGEPSRELHQVAVDRDADMIIVGAPGERHGMSRLFHRSTERELIRQAHVPVVVARLKDYSGLSKTPRPDPARPGQNLSSGLSSYSYVDFGEGRRDSHISGLL
jgi:nucleotide-binding universal stress UspA family protein